MYKKLLELVFKLLHIHKMEYALILHCTHNDQQNSISIRAIRKAYFKNSIEKYICRTAGDIEYNIKGKSANMFLTVCFIDTLTNITRHRKWINTKIFLSNKKLLLISLEFETIYPYLTFYKKL